MSEATIIRFRRQDPRGSRRISTREAYRRAQPQQGSGRAAGRRGGARPAARALVFPAVETDREGMATDYSLRLGPGAIARIRLEERAPDQFHIDWVFVPPSHRGSGVAGRLMARVIQDADAHGVRLSLEPRACAGPDQAALEAWYRGFGFAPSGRRASFGAVFVRRPAGARRAA